MARATLNDEREPLTFTPGPYHVLAGTITINGADMLVRFATPREKAECLPVLLRPWNADGVLHPVITKLNEYHPAKHTLDVLGFPVVVEFESAEDAVLGLSAYLDDLAPPAPAARKPRMARPAPPPPAPTATSTAAPADLDATGNGHADGEGDDAGEGGESEGEGGTTA